MREGDEDDGRQRGEGEDDVPEPELPEQDHQHDRRGQGNRGSSREREDDAAGDEDRCARAEQPEPPTRITKRPDERERKDDRQDLRVAVLAPERTAQARAELLLLGCVRGDVEVASDVEPVDLREAGVVVFVGVRELLDHGESTEQAGRRDQRPDDHREHARRAYRVRHEQVEEEALGQVQVDRPADDVRLPREGAREEERREKHEDERKHRRHDDRLPLDDEVLHDRDEQEHGDAGRDDVRHPVEAREDDREVRVEDEDEEQDEEIGHPASSLARAAAAAGPGRGRGDAGHRRGLRWYGFSCFPRVVTRRIRRTLYRRR